MTRLLILPYVEFIFDSQILYLKARKLEMLLVLYVPKYRDRRYMRKRKKKKKGRRRINKIVWPYIHTRLSRQRKKELVLQNIKNIQIPKQVTSANVPNSEPQHCANF